MRVLKPVKPTFKKTCRGCIYFDPATKYCAIYGPVDDVDRPPCIVSQAQTYTSYTPHTQVTEHMQRVKNEFQREQQVPTTTYAYHHTWEYNVSPSAPTQIPTYSQMSKTTLSPTPLRYTSDRAPTGIPELDRVLHGGLLRGKTYLVAGETGTGKTIFSIQFLLTGARMGEVGIYLAIDEPAEEVIRGLLRFKWDVRPYIRRGLLKFLNVQTHFEKIYLSGARTRISPKLVAERILREVRESEALRLVIDPIAPLMYASEDVLWAREYLRELIFALERERRVTTIMTSEIPTGSNKLSRFGVEEFLASGIIVLQLKEIKGRVHRVMYIRKMRWTPVTPMKLVYRIEAGKGIIVEGPLEKYYT